MKSHTTAWSSALALSCAGLVAARAQLSGMTVIGYQGWYPTWDPNHVPHDQVHSNHFKWFEPASGVVPGPPTPSQKVLTPVLPYVDDYPAECWENTNFILANGSHAQFFNSFCTPLIEKHFQYMVTNKIDGIFVQRFFDAATPTNDYYQAFLQSLQTIRQMAEKYGKYFAVEYDLGGLKSDADPNFYLQTLQNDYNNVVKPLFSSPSYIYNGTRPVIQIWGVGTNNETGLSGAAFKDIIQRYQAAPENPYMVIGVLGAWLFYNRSPGADPHGYWSAFQQANCIQPWPVGYFGSIPDFKFILNRDLIPGKAQTDAWGIDFSAAFWPGNNRYNGTFFEEQLKTFTNGTLKARFNFGAMFDEYTEGSQILPMIQNKNLPKNPNPGFIGSDDNKSVYYYMQLAGQYTTALHRLYGQQPLST